ncbi:MAG: hypothetical protein LBH07_07440 [Treponema sp.]|nr:hypothetical protein [Treponema sp.]
MMNKQKLEAIQRIAGFIVLAMIIGLAGCGSFGPWEITTPATCTEAAKEQRKSTDGKDKVQTRNSSSNPALGHEGLTGTVAATCTTPGNTGSGRCTRCGETVAARVIAALGHNWGSWQVTRAATKTAEGEEARVCTRNATHRETRVVEKLPDFVGKWEWVSDASDSTKPGWILDLSEPNLILSGSLIVSGKSIIEKETGKPETENRFMVMWWISRYIVSGDRLTYTIENKSTTHTFKFSDGGNTLTLTDQRDNTVRVFKRTK